MCEHALPGIYEEENSLKSRSAHISITGDEKNLIRTNSIALDISTRAARSVGHEDVSQGLATWLTQDLKFMPSRRAIDAVNFLYL